MGFNPPSAWGPVGGAYRGCEMTMTRAPEGTCTCGETPSEPCDYCQEMNVWAHYELYPEDEDETLSERCAECSGYEEFPRDGLCSDCWGRRNGPGFYDEDEPE